MWNCRFIKFLPEDLVCQHGRRHHVFPKSGRERKNVSILKHHFTFLYFSQTNEDVLFFLPQDRLARLCLSLPACPPAPETDDGLSICGNYIWEKCSGGLFSVCVAYQWAWSTHCTRSTRFTLQRHKDTISVGVNKQQDTGGSSKVSSD